MALLDLDNLTPGQEAVLQVGNVSRVVWTGAIRSGKGVGVAHALMDTIVRNRLEGVRTNHEYLVAGQSSGSFMANNEPYLQDIAEQYGLSLTYKHAKRPHYMVGNKWAKVYVYGGGNRRSHQNVRGLTLDSAWIDEATLCDESFVKAVEQRFFFPTSRLYLTQNADSPGHWLKRNIIDKQSKLTALIESTFDENQYYADERRQALLSLTNKETSDYLRMFKNMWAGVEGRIFPIPDFAIAKVQGPLVGDVFMDPGTAGTTAAILVVGQGNKRLILDEYYHIGDEEGRLTDEEHLRRLRTRKHWNVRNIYIDPESANMRSQAMRMGMSAYKAKNDFKIGVEVTNNALYAGWLTISDKCANLIDESASYVWNTTDEKPQAGVPDHLMDCMRYACMRYWPTGYAMIMSKSMPIDNRIDLTPGGANAQQKS